jgi:hypothetical protein
MSAPIDRIPRDRMGNLLDTYLVSVDLAQAADFTAISVLKRTYASPFTVPTYDLGHLERWQQVPYTQIGRVVRDRVAALRGVWPQPLVKVIYDRTGVGAAAGDVMEESGIDAPLISVTIHGGDQVSGNEYHGFRVPKRDLVSATAVVMQAGRLRIAKQLALAPVLAEELAGFKMTFSKTTGHDSYEAWREGVHDDCVLSVAMALWHWEYEDAKARGNEATSYSYLHDDDDEDQLGPDAWRARYGRQTR